MTYNRHTALYHCDICATSQEDDQLFTYFPKSPRSLSIRSKHLCLHCIHNGAYFCLTCRCVHANSTQCSQKQFLDTFPETWPPPV